MRIRYYQIIDEAIELIKSESERAYPLETGGILVGKFTRDFIVITQAIGPGPSAQHSSAQFKRDGEHSQQTLNAIVAETSGDNDYVGEWHSHLAPSGPSHIDLRAMNWIAQNKKYAVKQPVMALCSRQAESSWQLSVYLLDKRRLRYLKPSPKGK